MFQQMKITLSIAVIALLGVSGIFLLQKKSSTPSSFSTTTRSCDQMYDDIERDLDAANYCESESDCDVLMLGAAYVKFGCYHFINREANKEAFYQAMDLYNIRCNRLINECAPAPKPSCVSNKCVYRDEP